MKPDSPMESQRHELLSDVETHGIEVFLSHGIERDIAEQAAIAIADFLAEHWGGQLVSFPKDYQYKLSIRDLIIYHEFTGNNYPALVRKYQMTERGIRKIIDRVHRRETSRRQPGLFDPPPSK